MKVLLLFTTQRTLFKYNTFITYFQEGVIPVKGEKGRGRFVIKPKKTK